MNELIRLVVDSNCLESQELKDFLSASKSHVAVITDYAGMEIFKARLDTAVRDRISVLARFPQQVLVLRGTKVICGLRGRQAGLTRRMVDHDQTQNFQAFCEAVSKFTSGDERYRADINRKQQLARDHLSKVATDMSDVATHYAELESMFTPSEIRNIRLDGPVDWSAWKKFFFLVSRLAETLHQSHPRAKQRPRPEELPNTFLYRSALFHYLHFFWWIRHGSPKKLSTARIGTDQVDINFGVYATYFDGLMTRDQKSRAICDEATMLLENFILPASRG